MAVKPIVKIEVDDSKFKGFFQDFQKYDALLKAQVAVWGQVNAAMANSSKSLIPNFMTLGSITKTIAENLASAFRSLRDLAGLGAIAGLAGFGGSLFGINALANAASAFQRQSGGLGSTTGAMLAFRLNNERYVNPDSLLEKAADAKSDVTKRIPLNFLGVSNFNQDPAQIAYESMLGMRRMYQRYGGNTNILDSLGLNQLFSHDEMRRLGTSAPGELERQHQQEQIDRNNLQLSKDQATQWQNLKTQLSRAGMEIENTFIVGLVGLAGPLGELSSSFNDLVKAFLTSPVVRDGIQEVGHWLHEFSDYLKSPKFKEDVDKTLAALEKFETGIKKTYDWVVSWLPTGTTPNGPAVPAYSGTVGNTEPGYGPSSDDATGAQRRGDAAGAVWDAVKGTWHYLSSDQFSDFQRLPGAAGKFYPIEESQKLPKGLLWNLEGNESSHNTDPASRVQNSYGMLGPFQNSVDDAKQSGFAPIDRLNEAKAAEMTAKRIREYADMFGGDVEKGVASYLEGPGNVKAQIAAAAKQGVDWHTKLPKGKYADGSSYDVADYVRKAMIGVKVENNTGGSANVTVRSLGSAGSPAVPQ